MTTTKRFSVSCLASLEPVFGIVSCWGEVEAANEDEAMLKLQQLADEGCLYYEFEGVPPIDPNSLEEIEIEEVPHA